MKVGYPHMMRMKEHLKQMGVKRLGSADSAYKKLTAVGETKWADQGQNLYNLEIFREQAAEACRWLTENCPGAWRYGAQYRTVEDKSNQRFFQVRHVVQFENSDDAIIFKLSYRP